jgi:SAM-dependent methyltransferase
MSSRAYVRYVHPRSSAGQGGLHDWGLEVVSEQAPNYPRWLAQMCEPHLGREVLEVGAGHGSVTQHFLPGRHVVAVESSSSCASALRTRFKERSDIEIIECDLRDLTLDRLFDSVVMINTLEHIADDVAAVARVARFLRPSGRVVLYVPAFNFLYSDYDRKVGHYRRYTKPMLAAVLTEAGLSPVELYYANVLGFPAWLIVHRLLGLDSTEGKATGVWDRTGTVASRWLEARVRFPFGLNLLCVAQRR